MFIRLVSSDVPIFLVSSGIPRVTCTKLWDVEGLPGAELVVAWMLTPTKASAMSSVVVSIMALVKIYIDEIVGNTLLLQYS